MVAMTKDGTKIDAAPDNVAWLESKGWVREGASSADKKPVKKQASKKTKSSEEE
tara:strand:- start:3588 stop:3749 length:162 start_codon:yes stop_codon:yes gene_type:complete